VTIAHRLLDGVDPSQRREVANVVRKMADTFAEVPDDRHTPHTRDAGALPRLRLTGADPVPPVGWTATSRVRHLEWGTEARTPGSNDPIGDEAEAEPPECTVRWSSV